MNITSLNQKFQETLNRIYPVDMGHPHASVIREAQNKQIVFTVGWDSAIGALTPLFDLIDKHMEEYVRDTTSGTKEVNPPLVAIANMLGALIPSNENKTSHTQEAVAKQVASVLQAPMLESFKRLDPANINSDYFQHRLTEWRKNYPDHDMFNALIIYINAWGQEQKLAGYKQGYAVALAGAEPVSDKKPVYLESTPEMRKAFERAVVSIYPRQLQWAFSLTPSGEYFNTVSGYIPGGPHPSEFSSTKMLWNIWCAARSYYMRQEENKKKGE